MTPLELFEAHAPMVEHELRDIRMRYTCARLAHEDALQMGMLGLWVAALRFDAGRGLQFTTYARHCIWGHIRTGLSEYRYGCHHRATGRLDLSAFQLHGLEPGDVDTHGVFGPAPDDVAGDVERADEIEFVRQSLRHMPAGYGLVLLSRAAGRTLRDIAAEIGTSESRIWKIEQDAMATLRWALGA